MSSSAPGVHHGEQPSVGVVLLQQRLEARVVAEGVPMKAPLLPLRIQDGLELRVAAQGFEFEASMQTDVPFIPPREGLPQ